MIKPTRISYGGTAAIVTSMGMIAGLEAAHAGQAAIISALLIAAISDNLTDSLSIIMYQESERLEKRESRADTLANFATRLILCLSFVPIVLLWRGSTAALAGIVWGSFLLAVLSSILARLRKVSLLPNVAKHLAVALVVIFVSRIIGQGIGWLVT
jgi:VIT1/CCC1 family predicted Fe2+/Mn2+ transporter